MFTSLVLICLISTVFGGVPWIPEPRDDAWLARHEGFVNNSLTNGGNINVLFYGDSITDAWRNTGLPIFTQHYAPLGAANYGIGGDRTEHVLWRIINGEVQNLNPKLIVLKIGTNNYGANTNEDIARGVSTIIETLQSSLPQAKILLLGILPRINAEQTVRVEVINGLISVLDDGNSIRYLNMRDTFYSESGGFNINYYTADLVHLQQAGYAAWQGVMNALFQEMFNSTRNLEFSNDW